MLSSITKISLIGSRKSFSTYLNVIKYLLIPILGYVLYRQVVANSDVIDISVIYSPRYLSVILLLVFPLMIVNWGIETVKWKKIVSGFENITYHSAIKSVLCGVALAIVTPGRVGEYGGRLVGISADNKAKAVVANIVSSISQNVANISIGLIGTISYCIYFLQMTYATTVAVSLISLVALLILLFLYFKLDLLKRLLENYQEIELVKLVLKHSQFLGEYTPTQLTGILCLSYIRYITYTLQYVILIMLCGVTNNPFYAVLGVSVIFFIQSGLPLPPMLSVLARGEMALWIWSVFSTNVIAILTATFLLWIINLVIPTMVGSVVLWKSKIV